MPALAALITGVLTSGVAVAALVFQERQHKRQLRAAQHRDRLAFAWQLYTELVARLRRSHDRITIAKLPDYKGWTEEHEGIRDDIEHLTLIANNRLVSAARDVLWFLDQLIRAPDPPLPVEDRRSLFDASKAAMDDLHLAIREDLWGPEPAPTKGIRPLGGPDAERWAKNTSRPYIVENEEGR